MTATTTRRTLAQPAEVSGVALFTAANTTLRVHPTERGLCVRTPEGDERITHDLLATQPIHPAFADIPPRSTNLALPTRILATVEHALSALVGLGVTDAAIELLPESGPIAEVPIFDGSALPFAQAIAEAGVRDVGDIEPLTIDEPITVTSDDGASITAMPRTEPGCRYRYELDYGPAAPIPAQAAEITLTSDSVHDYKASVAPARTFSLQHEAEAMQAMGLFTHLSPKDMLVIGADGPIDNALRFDDEPARHKLLDLIGDLALAGRPLRLDITATRSGHALNHELARALAAHA